ncbi:MAG: type II toxin-antitoxin system VapC family toxin [Myxococcaceae bacterium]
MRLLLDTHVVIWLAEGVEKLSKTARVMIERAATGDGLAVSAISFWEVAMLADRGRISVSQPIEVWRQRVLAVPGLIEASVGGDVAIEAVQLPGSLHADPADRIIVATARINGWRLVTSDRRLLDYGALGNVAAVTG